MKNKTRNLQVLISSTCLLGVFLILFFGYPVPTAGKEDQAKETGKREENQKQVQRKTKHDPSEDDRCVNCHKDVNPEIVDQWRKSKHSGTEDQCLDCHRAEKTDPSGSIHYGARVTPVVTPKHCNSCHEKEVKEFKNSMHDEAALFSSSAFGIVEGKEIKGNVTKGKTRNYKTHFSRESAEAGCLDCHGTIVKVSKNGDLVNWPNMGMGRMNPDGSVGSCAACHTRHEFDLEQARKPETCGQCHLGPDHPQEEIYMESKHGNLYAAKGDEWNWDVPPEEWGPDDIDAPTCATCHMSGFGKDVKSTHNVSGRLKWELEPAFTWPTSEEYWSGDKRYPIDDTIARRYEEINDLPEGSIEDVPTGAPNPFGIARKSIPEDLPKYLGEGKWWPSSAEDRSDAFGGIATRSPEKKRAAMLKVCSSCHTREWAEGDLNKADATIDTYNAAVMAIKKKYYDPIKENKLDKHIKFNGKSRADTLWHEIWHHEGRIWRMGGFMQGQDWQHWEGAYEVMDDGTLMARLLEELKLQKKQREALQEESNDNKEKNKEENSKNESQKD